MPRALITGASGLLGQTLLPALDARWECWPLAHSHPVRHPRGLVGDLRSVEQVQAILGKVGPDIILHLAALADVDACDRDPDAAYRSNVLATQTLADAAAAMQVQPYFLHIGTDHVYDAPGPNREAEVRPRNVYALTKLWGEDAAARAGGAILRLNFFSLGIAGREGFAGWLIRSLAAKAPMKLFRDVFFNPIHAGALPAIFQRLHERRVRGTYNLGSSGPAMSKAGFARGLADEFGFSCDNCRDVDVADLTLAATRPRGMAMDVGAIERALDLRLPTLVEGIRALHGDWRQRQVAA